MNKIKELLARRRQRRAEKRHQHIVERSQELFQICEYNSNVWLTYDGFLVCPAYLLGGDDNVETLNEIRDLYIKRNDPDYDRRTNTESL